jgi:hypothetical protein
MTAPNFTERLKEKLEPWNTGPVNPATGKTDYDIHIEAIGAMFLPVEELAVEEGEDGSPGYVPPYGKLFDPVTCPYAALPYLAQYVGVSLPTGGSEAEWRALLLAESGMERGTLKAVETAVKRIAGETARVVERTGPLGEANIAYHFLVYVGTGKATQALYEAINSVKPAGIFYTVTEVTNTWLNGVKAHWTEVTVTKASEMIEPNY